MASSWRQQRAPQSHQEAYDYQQNFKKSDPVGFYSSHQFYAKATGILLKSETEPDTHERILNYLAIIPDHHFCLIKSICLDFGFYDPIDPLVNASLGRTQPDAYFHRIIRESLLRGGKSLVIKIQGRDNSRFTLGSSDLYQEFRAYFPDLCNDEALRAYLKNQTYEADQVTVVSVKKWRLDANSSNHTLEEITPPISETSSPAALKEDEDAEAGDCDLLDYFENDVFKINPTSKELVWDVWKRVRQVDAQRMQEWLANEFQADPFVFDVDIYLHGIVKIPEKEVPGICALLDVAHNPQCPQHLIENTRPSEAWWLRNKCLNKTL